MGWVMTLRKVVPVGLAVAISATTIGGCGGGGDVVTVTEESTTVVQKQRASDVVRSDADRAEQTVRSYYNAINNYAYHQAWDLLEPALQQELGGFSVWQDGYKT